MAIEIERKFLVVGDAWRDAVETSCHMVQAYVALDNGTSLRVRIKDRRTALLTVKFGLTARSRHEFEYPVPLADARQMVEASRGRVVEKTRHTISIEGFIWEVDVYAGPLSGLVTAEVELDNEADAPRMPQWLGREVTGDERWSNAVLALRGLPEDVST